MLHDRMLVLLEYVKSLVSGQSLIPCVLPRQRILRKLIKTMRRILSPSDKSIKADHSVVRQISALVSGLPVMSEYGFREEFLTVRTFVVAMVAGTLEADMMILSFCWPFIHDIAILRLSYTKCHERLHCLRLDL
jgi:hypothetical protein